MAKIDTTYFDLGSLDALAYRHSPIHALDPRAKLITTLIFIVTVVSFHKYTLSGLLPFLVFPLYLLIRADLPATQVLKKLLVALPFAFFIGIFNPFFDQEPLMQLGPLSVTGGWISFASILLRYTLTVTAALTLIATTSFTGICMALEKLGCPKVFALQLLFLYRYLFVLIDEASRLIRARALRTFHGRGRSLKVFGCLLGQLLLRSLERAQRIHLAMNCRGFDGNIHMRKPVRFKRCDALFILVWTAYFISCRYWNIPQLLGSFSLEIF
jgi:cobalt/nickel transport system permease protein